jgi:hypothetical protein
METKKLDADNKYQMKSLGSLDAYDVITAESSSKLKYFSFYTFQCSLFLQRNPRI